MRVSLNRSTESVESELKRLKLAVEAAKLGDWQWDATSDTVMLSERACAILGLRPSGAVTWSELRSYLHAEDRERARLEAERCSAIRSDYHGEYRILCPQKLRWISVRGRPLYDEVGQCSGMVGVVEDVTETKLLHEQQHRLNVELQIKINEWQSLFDTAPIAIWISLDPECKRVIGNHCTNSILGVQVGTNISRTPRSNEKIPYEIWQNGKPVSNDEYPLRIACFQGIPVKNCEQEVHTADGRRVSVLINAVPLYNEKQEVRGALATGLDITDRKKSEAALRESEQRFRLMADASPALIWMAGPDKLYTWVNKAWLDFVGTGIEAQLGDGWTEYVHAEDLRTCLQAFLEAFDHRHEFSVEYRVRRFDGEYRWLFAKGRPLFDSTHGFIGFIGSCVDITERKLHHVELEKLVEERTARMRESVQQLESFSYTVSHDMRAPLRSMEGFSHALMEEYGEKLDGTALDYLRRINYSARKLDLLIEHVLSYSRIATGQVAFGYVDLNAVLAEILAKHSEFASERCSVSVSLTESTVHANYGMVLQVFTNLLLNAVKFINNGVFPSVQVTSRRENEMVAICVRDNGIGISPSHRERIFEVFGRLHSESEYEGTGIGLAIVKKAVQMLGGRVFVESTLGKGSCFTVMLKK